MSSKRKFSLDDEAILPPPKKMFLQRFHSSTLPTVTTIESLVHETTTTQRPRRAPTSDAERNFFDIRGVIYSHWYLQEFRKCQQIAAEITK